MMRHPTFRSTAARSTRAAALVASVAVASILAAATSPLLGQDPGVNAQTFAGEEPGTELRVWLVTAAPGDAVWERYGHNAIRVLDTRTGRDVSYNWGIFDFEQVDFIPRFLQGRMLYRMAPFRTDAMIASYAQTNREVRLQELNLTPSQKLALRDFAEDNALPENRNYIYQYFVDNCSTRARDLLDLVLGGALQESYSADDRGASYRFHTRRLTQVDPLIYTGMDLLLGTPTDAPISVWDEMFVPMVLADELNSFSVADASGSLRPLVLNDEIVVPSSRAGAPLAPPSWLWAYLMIGLLVGGALAVRSADRVQSSIVLRSAVLLLGTFWSLLGGVVGLVLVGLLFTDHVFSYRNENLFLVNPLMLATAVLLPLTLLGEQWKTRARTWSVLVAGLALLGLLWHVLPWSGQKSAMFFALFLPAHFGLAWSLRDVAPVEEG